MVHRSIVPSPKSALSPRQLLRLTEQYLEVASKLDDDHDIALVLYQHAEAALHQAEGVTNKSLTTTSPEEQDMREKIAIAYHSLGKRLDNQGHQDVAQAFFKLSEEWSDHVPEFVQPSTSSQSASVVDSIKSAMTTDHPSRANPTCSLGQPETSHAPDEHGQPYTPTTGVTLESTQDDSLDCRSSVHSTVINAQDPAKDNDDVPCQEPDIDEALEWRCFVNEPSLLQFLAERAQREPSFKQQLFDYIEKSKSDKRWRVAASNAITILVRIGVQFNCADLRGIQIPKANLGYGVFESAQLQGADLSQTNLQNVWLRHADLSNAHLTGARFGEQPYLEQEREASTCAYSPDGKSLAVMLNNHSINAYSISTWEKLWGMHHPQGIFCMMYSPSGSLLATGNHDNITRLWDSETGDCRHVLMGHRGAVLSVAFSMGGNQVASASADRTVRLWNLESEETLCYTLAGHTDEIYCVVYSPKGNLPS
ncbi:hypothetical protein BGX31_002177 [Mortierella sp. GBA43]|nr:hypothetical protein BGX31_002177 [Mortierella sp. GBA43]